MRQFLVKSIGDAFSLTVELLTNIFLLEYTFRTRLLSN